MDTRDFKEILTRMQETLECSICLELLSNPVSTRCDHHFCSFCITKFLQCKRSVPCPLCKRPVTKRGIQDRSELLQVINNVKQLIAAYEADTRDKFTPSKSCKEVLTEAHNTKTCGKQASDKQVKTTTQATDCQDVDMCHRDSTSTPVAVGESKRLHPLVTDSVPRTRSRRRGQVVCLDADTVINLHVEESRTQSSVDLPDISEHRRSGRKRKLSFQSEASDSGNASIARQKEKLNDNRGLHDDCKTAHGDKDHETSNADILSYLEEGSCGAVQSDIPSNRNENSQHVISPCDWEINSKQEPADSSKKCNSLEHILQPGNRRRKPCKNRNSNSKGSNSSSSKKSVLESSKAELPPCATDSSTPTPNIPSLCAGSSQNIVTDESCDDAETQGNEALKHDSGFDLPPLASNRETAEDVCRIVSPSSDVSSVSSTQQLLKPKPVTARTYSRDMRKSFHDGFVKNWADTLPEKNIPTSTSLNQPKGLTTKEKIYAKKQKRQPIRLQEEVSNEHIFSNAETVKTDNNSLKNSAKSEAIFEPPLAQVPNRKSIFKSRTESAGNKSCVLDTTLPNEMTNQEDPFEFTVGHTPVKPKRKLGAQQKGLKTGKTEDVSDCKIQNRNRKMNMRKCEVLSIPLEHRSVSKLESTHKRTKFDLSSTEVENQKTLEVSTGVSKTLEKDEMSSCAHTENLLNSVTKKNKTVHFDDDLVDIVMQPAQGNISIPEANIISAEVNATVALDNQRCMQDEIVTPNVSQKQKEHPKSTAVPFSNTIHKATVDQKLQRTEDLLNSDKNGPINYNKQDLANESIEFQDTSVDVSLEEASHIFINKQKNKTQQSPDGGASALLPDSSKVSAPVQKRKSARRRKKLACPDTETFSQKAGKELTKLIHKINEAEDYELMFNTQDAHKKVQEELQKEQMLEEAFGFATQDFDHCRFSEAKDETESKAANTSTESKIANTGTESKTANTSTESKTANTGTESKTANTSTESKTANTGTESKIANTSTESKIANTGTESKAANTGTESKTANTGTESKTANTGTESKTANTGTESKTANTGTESKTANTGTESKTANTGTESKTANTSTESKTANTGTESKTANTGTESKAANTGTESKAANTGTESKIANTSPESKIANTGTESKAANTSPESKAANTGTESKIANTSTESKIANTGTESKAANTGTESKAANTGTESKIANTSTESKIANTGTESKIANTSTESKIANTGTESKIANTGTESKTANTGTESKAANTGTESKAANTGTETGVAHGVIQEMVDQSDHIEQINAQENQISPQQKATSVINMLKTNTHEKNKDLEVSSMEDKSVLTSIDIDNASVIASVNISIDRNDDWHADYQGDDRMNSTLLEPVEFGSEHINQMLQRKKLNSLHAKEHVATTPVDTRMARIFPRPNFSEMVQVSPCAKGVLTPTKTTLISGSATELHAAHMGTVSGKSSTSNISICEQPQMKQGGICSDQSVNSKVQTSNIAVGNRVKKQVSPGFSAKCMHSHILISNDEIPEYDPTDSTIYANTVLDGKFSDVNAVGKKTRIRTTLNTTHLSLKSKNTSEAAFVPPDIGSERVANYALGCDIILAPDTCIYSSSCRTFIDGSKHAEEEADVVLETLDLDSNLQYTNDVHSDHIVLSLCSPSNPDVCDQKSTLTTAATTNRSDEIIAESLISTTSSTQSPVISPRASLPQMMNEESSNCWVDPQKTKMTCSGTAELSNLSYEKNNNAVQSAAIVIASQETISGCSALSQSILLPTGASDKQGVHNNDHSHSDNCSRFQKHALDKNPSTCDNQSRSSCLTIAETPNSRTSPKNQINSAPCRITCSESEDDDYVLIVRRKTRKCFSLDGSPLKPVVFGSDQRVLERNLTPGTKNDECDVDLIGETEAMRVIDTWTERDVEDNDAKMSDCYISESLQCQQEGTMYLTKLRATEEIRTSTEQAINNMPLELLGKLQCVSSSGKRVSGLNSAETCVPSSKRKSQKRLFSPSSGAHLTRCEPNRQLENNSSEHRSGMTVITLSDNVNEDNQPTKLSEGVDTSVPETNIISQNDNSHKSGSNDAEDLLIDTGLDISLLENAAEPPATDSKSVSFELEKGKQTKRGLAKKGSLNLDTSVKHPRGQLSPASKAVVRSGIKTPTEQKIITDSDTDVICVDAEQEDTVGVVRLGRTLTDVMPDGSNKCSDSKKCDSDFEEVDSVHVARRREKVKRLPAKRKGKKSEAKTTETKYDAKKQLEKELFGLSSDNLISRTGKDKNHEIPADHTKHGFGKSVEKSINTACIGSGDDNDELFFDLGDSSDDDDGHVKMNARSVENKNEKSGVVDELDDTISMSGSLPVTSSPVEAGNGRGHGDMDQSVITAVDETDIDDEDSMYTWPKSRMKRFQIASDSEDSNQEEANPVRSSANGTSSSALSSQSEILNTEQQEALEEDVANLHQQIAEYEAKLAQEGGDMRLTPATQEGRPGTKAECDRHTPEEDEDSDDLFVVPLSSSPPPPRQSSVKPVPKRPAHSKPSRQIDQFIKQFQSPGGTVRTKKSLEFTSSTASSHSQTNNLPLFSGKANLSLDEANVPKKQSSDRVLHDITFLNIVPADIDKMDEVMDMNDPSEDKLMLSPVILSQKSRQSISQSEKRDVNSSVANRCLRYPLDKDVCLVASALGREEYLLMVKMAERYGLKFTSQFSTEVTHVVMKPATGYDRVCDRTLKFFQGVAYKCWVVSFPWVLDSLQAGSLLPEEDYEIVGDTSGGENTFGAKHSRLSRELLFTDFCLACVGDSREMPKENLHELLTVCGATVVDDPIGLLSKVAKFKIIVRCSDSNIAPTTAELDMFNGLYKHMGLLTVMREWVLDSLGSYRLQPLIEYVLNTGVVNVPF